MTEPDPEYYKHLQKELTSSMRWCHSCGAIFAFCLGMAIDAGSNAGWNWLIVSLFFLMSTLWNRLDELHNRALIQIYLSSVK